MARRNADGSRKPTGPRGFRVESPLEYAMKEARAAMPDVDEMAGYACNHRCLCAYMSAPPGKKPRPCVPCRSRRYADALRAYCDSLQPPSTAPQPPTVPAAGGDHEGE
jgi:hypothetical protein